MWTEVFLATVILAFVQGQVPIPKREVGYVYNGGNPGAHIHIDFFIDEICPGSKEAFPTMMLVAGYYGSETLQLTSHLFPLPYHRASFYATKGARVINTVTQGNLTYKWIQTIYDNIDSLTTAATHDISDAQIVQKLANFAQGMGISGSTFTAMVDTDDIEMNTRIAWKYACTRGVAGTPTFMVNDILVQASPTWTLEDWKTVIDPLLTPSVHKRQLQKTSPCSNSTRLCEYLPGKSECCTKGEYCIPNVGCRC